MKTNLLKTLSLLLLMTVVIAGCQKNATEKIITPVSAPARGASVNAKQSGCKLILENMHGNFWQTYTYNQNNYVDKWVSSFANGLNYITKLSYHSNGQLSRADLHISRGSLKEYANFTYQNGRITKVEWRYAASGELDYELFISYNANGQVAKFDMPAFNYYITYAYNNDRNVAGASFYFDNVLTYYTEYIYTRYIPGCYMPLLQAGLPFDFLSPWIHDFPQFPDGTNAYQLIEATNSYELQFQLLPQNTTFSVNNSGVLESITRTEEFTGEVIKADYNYTNCGNGNPKQANLPEEGDPAESGKILDKSERMKILKEVMIARIPKAEKIY